MIGTVYPTGVVRYADNISSQHRQEESIKLTSAFSNISRLESREIQHLTFYKFIFIEQII